MLGFTHTHFNCAHRNSIGKSCRARFLIAIDQIVALYLFLTLKILQSALTACCGLLAMAHHRAINYQFSQYEGDDKAFSIGLRGHQILPLVYSSSRGGFHYTFTFPPSLSNKRCIYYCRRLSVIKSLECLFLFTLLFAFLCTFSFHLLSYSQQQPK